MIMNNFDEKKLIQKFSKIQDELLPRIKLENKFSNTRNSIYRRGRFGLLGCK